MSTRAFSLLELMVVIAIIGIISAFAVPAFSTVVNGTTLNQASTILTNELSAARQYAITKNRSVEVRFLRYLDPEIPGEGTGSTAPPPFRAIQLLEVLENGAVVPFGNIEMLPQATVLGSGTKSSLLDAGGTPPQMPQSPMAGVDLEMPRGVKMNYSFVSFRFLPNGSTNLAANRNWFVTVIALKDQNVATQLPPNFFTLQVDPVSGITRGFRPGLR